MKKILAGLMIFVIGLICGLIFTYGSIHAQGAINENDVMSKLKEISDGQTGAMTVLNAIREDVQLIKIRITQMQ